MISCKTFLYNINQTLSYDCVSYKITSTCNSICNCLTLSLLISPKLSVKMLGHASLRYILLIFFKSHSLAFEDIPTIRNNDHTPDVEARINPLGREMVLRIDEMQYQMEKMQRIIAYQAQLLEDNKYAIERVNASICASDKYKSSITDVL